jgi:hypothetical protein
MGEIQPSPRFAPLRFSKKPPFARPRVGKHAVARPERKRRAACHGYSAVPRWLMIFLEAGGKDFQARVELPEVFGAMIGPEKYVLFIPDRAAVRAQDSSRRSVHEHLKSI